jgi:hypothetical protein
MALHAQTRQLAKDGRAAWLRDRNIHNVKADGRLKTADARIKLKSLYSAL